MKLHPWDENGGKVLRITVDLLPANDGPPKRLGVIDVGNVEHLKGDTNRYQAKVTHDSGWTLKERAAVNHEYGDGWGVLVAKVFAALTGER